MHDRRAFILDRIARFARRGGQHAEAWHGTGWQTIFNRSMHASRAFMAGRLARQIPGLAWETFSCHGFRARRWNYFLEIDDFFLEVVNN
jgi:hypothetical protein